MFCQREHYAKKMGYVTHKIYISEGLEMFFKVGFDIGVSGEVNEIVNINANVDWKLVRIRTAMKDTWCIGTRFKFHGRKDSTKFIRQVPRSTMESIEGTEKAPEISWMCV